MKNSSGSISTTRKCKITLLNILMYAAAVVTIALLIGLVAFILFRGVPYITLKLVTGTTSFIKNTVGILPNILNTVYVVLTTLIIVLPIGVGAAVYLNEYAKSKRIVKIIELAAETLSGIPSIIYGLIGMLIFSNFFKLGTSLLAGSLTLVIVTFPPIIRTTQESLKSVPQSYREGALALGAGRWHMIRTVVLPSSIDGIVTGCILAVGRIVGESAALLFTAGAANNLLGIVDAFTPEKPGSTLTVALYMYAKERGDFNTAFAIAAILLIITFLINLAAKSVKKIGKRSNLN